jgi:transcriptional regulator with XRE-family HTH domain
MDKSRLTIVIMDTASKTPGEALRRRQGGRIKDFRQLRKMSQSDLAGACSVTKAAVSEWENGKSTPRQHLQVKIAKALDAPWSALFGLDGEAA